MNLPYPLGISDINFDEENFKKIKHFFYIGEDDVNNPALPICELSGEKDANGNPLPKKNSDGSLCYILDENGMVSPFYPDCYSKEEINIIHRLYGHNNIERFKKNAHLYKKLNIDALYKIYPGNHSTIFLNKEMILDDMINVISSATKENFINDDLEKGQIL